MLLFKHAPYDDLDNLISELTERGVVLKDDLAACVRKCTKIGKIMKLIARLGPDRLCCYGKLAACYFLLVI